MSSLMLAFSLSPGVPPFPATEFSAEPTDWTGVEPGPEASPEPEPETEPTVVSTALAVELFMECKAEAPAKALTGELS